MSPTATLPKSKDTGVTWIEEAQTDVAVRNPKDHITNENLNILPPKSLAMSHTPQSLNFRNKCCLCWSSQNLCMYSNEQRTCPPEAISNNNTLMNTRRYFSTGSRYQPKKFDFFFQERAYGRHASPLWVTDLPLGQLFRCRTRQDGTKFRQT